MLHTDEKKNKIDKRLKKSTVEIDDLFYTCGSKCTNFVNSITKISQHHHIFHKVRQFDTDIRECWDLLHRQDAQRIDRRMEKSLLKRDLQFTLVGPVGAIYDSFVNSITKISQHHHIFHKVVYFWYTYYEIVRWYARKRRIMLIDTRMYKSF